MSKNQNSIVPATPSAPNRRNSKDKAGNQTAFLEALKACNGIVSTACKAVGMSRSVVEMWKKEPEFLEKLNEIREDTNDFIEGALLQKVAEGDTACILFCARTKLRQRGYSEKVDVGLGGKIDHNLQIEVISRAEEVDRQSDETAMQ